MRKILFLASLCIGMMASKLSAGDIVGFWKSIDEDTKRPQSIVAIYPYNGKYYGRLIATYDDQGQSIKETINNPQSRAPGVKGHPYYAGLDFIWDLSKDGEKYVDGQIMDPEKGRIYDAEAWREGNNLIVRGQFLFIGRNQKWPPAQDSDFPPGFEKPDLNQLTPQIPQVK